MYFLRRRWLLVLLPVAVAGIAIGAVTVFAPSGNGDGSPPVPRTEDFPATLTATGIYQGSLATLEPADGYHLVDLQSSLFADDSQKQRLLYIPEGSVIQAAGGGLPEFPEGTTLVKTFYYHDDDRDPALGRHIIETRLLTLEQGLWNVATYVWNDEQTEAVFEAEGAVQVVDWIDEQGRSRSVEFQVPTQRQCVSCHQKAGAVFPLGPELRNLNLTVSRNGSDVNQLDHLQAVGALDTVDPTAVDVVADYLDASLPISERGRAYLDMNCSHCHQPDAWSRPARQGYDFRWETPLAATGVTGEEAEILEQVESGEMPFLGTTFIDDEGLAILTEYLERADALGAGS
ncbi:MAG: hypothetical protein AAF467_00975 [Actinomycetota bacterium]